MSRTHSKAPALAGRLANSPLPELLAYACNHRFTGALVLEPRAGERSGLFFQEGAVFRARTAGVDQALARQVLEQAELSQEDLVSAARFARQSGRDVFSSVQELALLSQESLEIARARFVEGQVHALSRLPVDTVYGFFPELDTLKKAPGPKKPLPPLNLIIACILNEGSIDRFRGQLEPFKTDRLLLRGQEWELGPSTGAVHAVVSRLRRSPHSFEELRLLNVVDERELVACVYALRLTQRLAPEGNVSARASTPLGVPRRASSQSLNAVKYASVSAPDVEPRDTLPEVGYAPPAGLASEPPRRKLSAAEQKRYWQEQSAESRALEAWAKAEGGDPAQLEKALQMVEKAVEFFPKNPRIRYYAGCLYRSAQRLDEAASEFRRVLSIDPDNIEAKTELELLNRRSGIPPSKGVFQRLRKKR